MSEPIASAITVNALTAAATSTGIVVLGVNLGVPLAPLIMACVGTALSLSLEGEGNLIKKSIKLFFTAYAAAGMSVFVAQLFHYSCIFISRGEFNPDIEPIRIMAAFFLGYLMHKRILPASDKLSSSWLDKLKPGGKAK